MLSRTAGRTCGCDSDDAVPPDHSEFVGVGYCHVGIRAPRHETEWRIAAGRQRYRLRVAEHSARAQIERFDDVAFLRDDQLIAHDAYLCRRTVRANERSDSVRTRIDDHPRERM